jgi:hypothetical protein
LAVSKKFAGKIAVVTGGSTGMGLATAKRFVQEGMDHVFITGRRKDSDAAVAEIGKNVTAVQGLPLMKNGGVIVLTGSIADTERLFINERVHEAFPAANVVSTKTIESGIFYGIAHPTEGTATIYRMGDGALMLRFTNFRTSNGPNVHVYLVAADDAKESETVLTTASSIWGRLKGTSATKTMPWAPIWTCPNTTPFHLVRTLQCEFRRCIIKARSGGPAELSAEPNGFCT